MAFLKIQYHNLLKRSLINLNKTISACGHTDLKPPDFSEYRRKERCSSQEDSVPRKLSTYTMVGATTVCALYGAKAVATSLIASMAASADVLALAQVEINLNDIPEGKSATFKWRSKPLFISHRTTAVIEDVRSVPIETLRDPEKDEDRIKRDDFLIVIGVCTHLGCVPIFGAGDFPGGYYCPCHGSHFDGSGRVRKGPAPLNLRVPFYEFINENTIVVG